jgi:polyhydroxyalkanoate synthesis regulator phasin
MIEILKKTFMTGVGLAAKGWDEVEVLSKEIAKKAKMSEKEGAKFLKDMRKRYDDTQKKTGNYVENVVKDILKKMDIATSADIKALKKEIQQLKKAVGRPTTQKRSRTTAAKKRTSSTTAKKRTRTTTAKKTAGRASAKKRSGSTSTKKPARRAAAKKS